jgi:23S rRNA pseudoU1915 N3-methylase RlmH
MIKRSITHRNISQVTLVYGLAQLFLVEQLFRDLEQIM